MLDADPGSIQIIFRKTLDTQQDSDLQLSSQL